MYVINYIYKFSSKKLKLPEFFCFSGLHDRETLHFMIVLCSNGVANKEGTDQLP